MSALQRLLKTTPAIQISTPPVEEEEEEAPISPADRMLLSGVLSGSINECILSHILSYKMMMTRQYTYKKNTHQEQWSVIVSYPRFRALQEYYQHIYPQVTLPRLPAPIKLNANANTVQSHVNEMNEYLQGILNLRNSCIIDSNFVNEQVEAEKALLSDLLQVVLRGYSIHNPFGQSEGGVRVKLVLDEEVPFGYLKEESRLALQNNCCADCGIHFDKKNSLFKKEYRYCEYSHYFYCMKCHSNKTTIIPSKLVRSWDYKTYPVANVCKEYLDNIYDQPIICISAVNPEIMEKVLFQRICDVECSIKTNSSPAYSVELYV